MALRKLVDTVSGEVEELEECPDCNGLGGFDASKDCEEYDDWQDCQTCDGNGNLPAGFAKTDTVIPGRDAWTPND